VKLIVITGMILIVLGAVGLIYGGITYTSKKNIVDLGSIEVQVDENKEIALPPIIGGAAVAAGIALLFVGRQEMLRGRAV
jgi:hypothetical protein